MVGGTFRESLKREVSLDLVGRKVVDHSGTGWAGLEP